MKHLKFVIVVLSCKINRISSRARFDSVLGDVCKIFKLVNVLSVLLSG